MDHERENAFDCAEKDLFRHRADLNLRKGRQLGDYHDRLSKGRGVIKTVQ